MRIRYIYPLLYMPEAAVRGVSRSLGEILKRLGGGRGALIFKALYGGEGGPQRLQRRGAGSDNKRGVRL